MKIIGLLSAYDESSSWLAACVAGLGRFCDAVIYVDGGYALYPTARPRSMPDQAEAVLVAAEAADVELIMHRPKDIWRGNEVQKRNATLAFAGVIAQPDEDWVAVCDADMHVMRCTPEVIRWELEHTEQNVATITTVEDLDQNAEMEPIGKEIDIDYEWTQRHRLIYRWHPSLAYGPAHWHVSRDGDNGVEWLWGPSSTPLADAVDMNENLVFYHRSGDRPLVRKIKAQNYYETRDMFGVEKPKQEVK